MTLKNFCEVLRVKIVENSNGRLPLRQSVVAVDLDSVYFSGL